MRDRLDTLGLGSLALIGLLLNVNGILWGLPNGDGIWATDSLTPMAPLAVTYRLFAEGWNSGWFYYKYPSGHPLLLAAVYAPYLVWLKLTGGLGRIQSDYPYGFTDPETALFVLALLGRCASAVMTIGAGLLVYLTIREIASRRAAWLAGFFFLTTFPVVYYAHTTNVDAALMFWCALALYAATRVSQRGRAPGSMVVFGVAAAMALSTKEYTMGFVTTLALCLGAHHVLRRWRGEEREPLPAGTWAGLGAAVVVFIVMNGIFFNPLGMWHRALFLTDSMPEGLRQQYAPRFSHVGSAAPKDFMTELRQFGEVLRLTAVSIGWPSAVLAAIATLLYGWRRPLVLFVAAALGYYLVSLRALEMLHPRYVLPVSIVGVCLAGFSVDAAIRGLGTVTARRVAAAITVLLVLYAGMRGAEATMLLRHDTRYEAEEWMRERMPAGASVEVYQRLTYLPRFSTRQRLDQVPFDEISVAHFGERRPDFVVLSSAGIRGVTAKFKNALEENVDAAGEGVRTVARRGATGDVMAYEYNANREFLDALRGGCLGYRLAAEFRAPHRFTRPIIPSLAPTIWIYAKDGPPAAEPCESGVSPAVIADEGDWGE